MGKRPDFAVVGEALDNLVTSVRTQMDASRSASLEKVELVGQKNME